ncbi:cellulase family glycosylhydrolase [Mycolicibacterium fluoranthenivorans]|uniref:Cellulase family glycosylhydrolase n=1 Tax=Mycolicibacterium fluoranthenivorans TaxID=258505 RepID=A0A7G8P7G9_9MYCO|nr:cellulase family glycosylhydrolase [Mycolicibacterium fluoranthenivorans]QNJ90285.1 cellulase family glycosylhydrolase [Mycolicibacterium fluoranthenivorans]
MFTRRDHRISRLNMLFVPLLSVAVIGASAGLWTPSPPRLTSAEVELTATIDTSSSTTGIADSDFYFMSKDQLTTAMQELQAIGVTQIRVYLPWRQMEPTNGGYNWTQADQLLDTAASYGIAVDAAITSTPKWATTFSGAGWAPNGAPTSDADYAAFVSAVASRYGAAANNGDAKISAYEIWNEPNGFAGWSPTPNAAAYTALLKAAYTAIKAVDPSAEVIAGALGAGVTIGSLTVNPVTFLTQMYADGAAGFFDALSFHPYSTSLFSAGATVANSALQQLKALRALMNANGDALKLIWATEYGEPATGTNGETKQATFIQDFLSTWATLSGVGPSFIFSLVDSDYSGGTYGLFTSKWTPRAAVAVVKSWIAAHPVTTAVVSTADKIVANQVTALRRAAQAVATGVTTAADNAGKAAARLAAAVSTALTNAGKSLSAATKPKTATAKTATAAASSKSAVSQELSTKTAKSTKTSTAKPSTKHIRGKHAAVKASS